MPVITDPKQIEAKSFEIIKKILKDRNIELPLLEKEVVKRVIHATADWKYSRELLFHPQAISSALSAIKKGGNIIVDAQMVKAGINKKIVSRFKEKIICFIEKKDVISRSRKLKVSRAMLAMKKASRYMNDSIIAIGNAPTALVEVCHLVEKEKIYPALIIGVPVGFVGAKEAKKKLSRMNIPYITNISRKGGSSVASSIVNALLKIADRKYGVN